jgi:hypothetical protein
LKDDIPELLSVEKVSKQHRKAAVWRDLEAIPGRLAPEKEADAPGHIQRVERRLVSVGPSR